jgi:hypothetical protein
MPEDRLLDPAPGGGALDELPAGCADDELPDPGRSTVEEALEAWLTPDPAGDELEPADLALVDELDDGLSGGGGSGGGVSASVSWHGSQSTGGQQFACAAYGGYGGYGAYGGYGG